MLISATKLSERVPKVLNKMFSELAMIYNHEFYTTTPLIVNGVINKKSRKPLTLSSPVVPNGYTTKCSKPYWSNPPFLFF